MTANRDGDYSLSGRPGQWATRLSPLFLMLALIAGFATIPGTVSGAPFEQRVLSLAWLSPALQNSLHIPVYAALSAAWMHALGSSCRMTIAIPAALFATVLCGVAEEGYQTLIPGRTSSPDDVLRDAIGAAVGITLVLAARRWRRPRRTQER